jgi:hypothetical protein
MRVDHRTGGKRSACNVATQIISLYPTDVYRWLAVLCWQHNCWFAHKPVRFRVQKCRAVARSVKIIKAATNVVDYLLQGQPRCWEPGWRKVCFYIPKRKRQLDVASGSSTWPKRFRQDIHWLWLWLHFVFVFCHFGRRSSR